MSGGIIAALTLTAQPGSPAGFRIQAGAVHVWVANLDAHPGARDPLSDEERTRANRFLDARDGRRWSRAREVLRLLLAEYLQSDAHVLRFATNAHGKPELEGHPQGVRFNVSHSGGVALYAVAEQPVGVDVELGGKGIDVLPVAERAFGATVKARLSALDPEPREREFLREWVRHEAVVKCLGRGLGEGPLDEHPRRPWVTQLELGDRWATAGATAAVASIDQPTEVSCWEWEG